MLYIKIVILLIGLNLGYSQEQNKGTRMVDFSPKSKAYNIYYPSNYNIAEDHDIVSITNAASGLNITISSFSFQKNIQEEDLRNTLSGFVKEIKKTDWKSYQSKFDNLLEGRIENENDHWVWWAISLNKKAVFLSINKINSIDEEEIKLVRFMIENLEIH